jgi:two-component system, NarL family, nitrate/nitrite response regulator NarL
MPDSALLQSGTEAGSACARPVRLAVVDSHRLFRECLAAALREDAGFAGVETMDADQAALGRLDAGEPADVVLLGGGETDNLLELLRQARQRQPDAKILVLGTEEGEEEALALLREGARGYLFRDQSLDELRDAILEVAAGATPCTPRIAHLLFSRLGELGRERRRDERLELLELTAREIEILRLIADGLKNQEIAARLYLSVHTVKNHVHNILERLGVKSRWSAVTHACDKGWLQAKRRFPA